LYFDGHFHPNTHGVTFLKRPIQSMLDINQYNKI